MTNFVFGILIGLFILAALLVAALVFLEWRLNEPGVLIAPLGLGIVQTMLRAEATTV